MAEKTRDDGMSRAVFQIAYAGDDDRHSMDIEQLAPALLAFGDLIRETNFEINSDRATVRVFVVGDFEHKCFNINFEVIQTILRQIMDFFKDEDVQSAQNIVQWLGICGGSMIGLLKYLKIRKGRKIEKITEIADESKKGNVYVKFEGDNNQIEIHQHVYQLGENTVIRHAVEKAFVEPLIATGYDRVETIMDGKKVGEITKQDIEEIAASCAADREAEPPRTTEVVASLYVYSPVYDEAAQTWDFNYEGKHVPVDISETTIARDAMKRGGVLVGDIYRVRLEIEEYKTEKQTRKRYKIKEVVGFKEANKQLGIFDGSGES